MSESEGVIDFTAPGSPFGAHGPKISFEDLLELLPRLREAAVREEVVRVLHDDGVFVDLRFWGPDALLAEIRLSEWIWGRLVS